MVVVKFYSNGALMYLSSRVRVSCVGLTMVVSSTISVDITATKRASELTNIFLLKELPWSCE